MRVIHKQSLMIAPDQMLYVPGTVDRVLCVQVQHQSPMIWYTVEPAYGESQINIRMAGTGFDDPGREYLGTTQMDDGDHSLVWHWFYEIVVVR